MSALLDIDGRAAWIAPFAPTRDKFPFRLEEIARDGAIYYAGQKGKGLSVVVTGTVEADGKRWIHVSCSRRAEMPSWADVRLVKEAFIGADRYAVQVFPPADRYVSIHPFCLHLFHCVDGHPLPEFSGVVGGTRTL